MARHILVVDDDPLIRNMLTELLNLEGYMVQTAENGDDALRSIERDRPSLLLLDMRMPVVDGWEVVRRLHLGGSTLPIVILTAEQSPDRCRRETGADACLPKPFDIEDLLDTVARVGRDG